MVNIYSEFKKEQLKLLTILELQTVVMNCSKTAGSASLLSVYLLSVHLLSVHLLSVHLCQYIYGQYIYCQYIYCQCIYYQCIYGQYIYCQYIYGQYILKRIIHLNPVIYVEVRIAGQTDQPFLAHNSVLH
jgi:hypothetical protein